MYYYILEGHGRKHHNKDRREVCLGTALTDAGATLVPAFRADVFLRLLNVVQEGENFWAQKQKTYRNLISPP
jgi:hypothetical protein